MGAYSFLVEAKWSSFLDCDFISHIHTHFVSLLTRPCFL